MYKNNNLIPENKKPVETVYELKDYEIKKSPLSPAARGKTINKSGSNYVSEDKEGYGPTYRHQYQLQTQKQLSPEIYELFKEAITWLEKYIEVAGYYSDWEQRKPIKSKKNDIIPSSFQRETKELEGERIKKIKFFSSQEKVKNQLSTALINLQCGLKDQPSSFREKLKEEFYQWIKAAEIDVDSCPSELKRFILGFNEVLEGREEKFIEELRISTRTSSQIIQDLKTNPQNWRLDEIPTEIDNFGKIKKQEFVLIHCSAREDEFDQRGKLNFANNPIYRTSQFNRAEMHKINKTLNISSDYLSYERKVSQQITESFCQYQEPSRLNTERNSSSKEPSKSGRKSSSKSDYNEQHLIDTFNNRTLGMRKGLWDYEKSEGDEGKLSTFKTSGEASFGVGGVLASGSAEYSLFRIKDEYGEAKYFSGAVGSEIGIGTDGFTAKAELGVDLANAKIGGVRASIGANLNTGGSVGRGGVELTVAGVGFSIGKKTGISTMFGELSINFEETCVVQ